MFVTISTRNSFDTPKIPGDLSEIVKELNHADVTGHAFATFRDVDDKWVAIKLSNITVMREVDDDDLLGG